MNQMLKWNGCISFLLLCVFGILSPLAQSAESSSLPVKEARRIVRVGFFPFEGYHMVSPDGRRSGYGYDYLQHLKLYGRWNYEYSSPERGWPDMLPMLESGQVDLVTSVHKTPEREALFAFSHYPIGQSATVLTVKAGNFRYRNQDYANWDGIKIGFLRASTRNQSFEQFARNKGFSYLAIYYENSTELINDLRKGNVIDAAVTSNLRDLSGEWIYEQFDPAPFYVVVRKSDTALMAEIDYAMEQLDAQHPELRSELWRKYYQRETTGEISFTAEEYDFIQNSKANKRTFHAILNPDRAPLSFHDSSSYQGLLKQLADEIIFRTGLDIRFTVLKTRKQYSKACLDPEVDIVFDAAMDYSLAEQRNLVLCEPYFSSTVSFLSLKEFTGEMKRVALVADSDLAANIRARLPPSVQVFYFNSTEDAVKAVKNGSCDGMYLYTRCAEAILNSSAARNMKATYANGCKTDYAVAVRDSISPILASILNKVTNSLDADFIEKLEEEQRSNLDPVAMDPAPVAASVVFRLGGAGLSTAILLAFVGVLTGLLIIRKRRYRMGVMFQQLPLRYFVVTREGNILFCALGSHSESFPKKIRHLDDLPDAKVNHAMLEAVHEVLESRETKTVDFYFLKMRRSAMVTPLPHETFGCECAVWISQDTSELQQTRESAKLSEGYFRLTLNAIGDGVIATDARGNVIMLNPVAERLIGMKTREAAGKSHEEIFNIVGAYDNQPMQSPLRRTLRTGTIVELANHTDLLSLDGSRYHIADSSAPVFDENKRIIGGILVFRDVSEEYANRDRLQQALTSLEYGAELSHSAAFTYAPATGVITGTKNLKNLWPISGNNIAKPLEDWVFAEDCEEVLRHLDLLRNDEIKQAACRYRAIFNGEMRYYELRCSCDRSEQGTLRLVGAIQDITELKKNIEKVQNTQALWEEVVNHIPFMFAIKDVDHDFRYTFCNDAFAEFIGKTKEEIFNYNATELHLAEADFAAKKDRECLTGKTAHYILTLKDSSGKMREFQSVKRMFCGKDGRRMILLGMNDITELQSVIRNEIMVRHVLERVIKSNDFIQTLEHISSALRERFDCDRVILARCEREEEFKFYWEWHSEVLPELKKVPLEKHESVWNLHLPRLKQDEFIQYDDFHNQQHMQKLFPGGTPYLPKSLGGVPIFNDGKLWGVLMVSFSRKQRSFDPSDEKFLRALGSIIALAYVVDSQEKQIQQTHYENQLILNNIKIPISLFDGERNLVYANTALAKLVGMPVEEIYRQPCYETFHCGHNNPEECLVLQTQRDRKSHNFLYEAGKKQYVTESYPIINDEGTLLYTLECAIDVTEVNKLSENEQMLNFCLKTFFEESDVKAAIRKVEEAICRYLNASRCFVMHFDLENCVANCETEYVKNGSEPMFLCKDRPIDPSEGWCQAFQKHQMLLTEEMDQEKGRAFYGGWAEVIEKARTKSFYVGGIYLDGNLWGDLGISYEENTYQFSEMEKSFITNAAHMIEVLISRHRTQSQIWDAMCKAQAADRAKSYFLASMSHEIRTPLNSVLGFTELLQEEKLAEDTRKEYLDCIASSGDALLALINDILDLSKLEAQQMDFYDTDLNFPALVHEVTQLFSAQSKKHDLEVREEFSVGFPQMIRGDKARLRQILFNLVGNAVKFTPSGEVLITGKFDPVSPTVGTLQFQVVDSGIGIAPEDQRLLFQPFVQTKATRGTFAAMQGTGLGLSIVQRMLKYMHGTIQLESTLGKGSVFTVTLQDVEYLASPMSPAAAGQVGAAQADEDSGFQKILVVDDVALNVKVLCAMLKALGATVFQATSGAAALEILQDHNEIDAVLTDLWMPEMNGEQLAEKIRNRRPEMFIAAITADIECQQNFDMSRFDIIVNKPISKTRMFELLSGKNKTGQLK